MTVIFSKALNQSNVGDRELYTTGNFYTRNAIFTTSYFAIKYCDVNLKLVMDLALIDCVIVKCYLFST